jgi:SAM-dependent methyltransferase
MNFHPKENSSDTANIVVPLLIDMYNPNSVLDLGCNIGAWLKAFELNGVCDVLGLDGDNMITDLVIDKSKFLSHDLTTPINLKRRFDIVLCLEVAEHIDEVYSNILINNAINHSDLIIWSAAIPGQGGYNHFNEQPVEYWIAKFEKKGFKYTNLSNTLPLLPHDYYRKNAIEFKRK